MKVWGVYSNKLEQFVGYGRLPTKKLALHQLDTYKKTALTLGKDISDYEVRPYELRIYFKP
jgi:hypothetical protein